MQPFFSGRVPRSRFLAVYGFIVLLIAYAVLLLWLVGLFFVAEGTSDLAVPTVLVLLGAFAISLLVPVIPSKSLLPNRKAYRLEQLRQPRIYLETGVPLAAMVGIHCYLVTTQDLWSKYAWREFPTYVLLDLQLLLFAVVAVAFGIPLHFLLGVTGFVIAIAREWSKVPLSQWTDEDFLEPADEPSVFGSWPDPDSEALTPAGLRQKDRPVYVWRRLERRAQDRADLCVVAGQMVIFIAGGSLAVFAPQLIVTPTSFATQLGVGVSVVVAIFAVGLIARWAPMYQRRSSAYHAIVDQADRPEHAPMVPHGGQGNGRGGLGTPRIASGIIAATRRLLRGQSSSVVSAESKAD